MGNGRHQPRLQQFLSWSVAVAVVALGLRAFVFFAFYAWRQHGVLRFHVEAASVAFVVVVVAALAALTITRQSPDAVHASSRLRWPGVWLWFVFVAAALVLYWPALTIGLLSDDYIFFVRAVHWHLGPVSPLLFRPVVLAIWSCLIALGSGPVALHLVNVVLHGTNSYLAVRLAGRGERTAYALAAGLFVLTNPLGTEAVAWASGMFDVLSTTFVLLAVLMARRYALESRAAVRIGFLALAILAMFAKETAAVAAALALADYGARRIPPKLLIVDCVILFGIEAGVALVRLLSAYGATAPAISRYDLQRALFGTFGSLIVPFSVNEMAVLGVLSAGVVTFLAVSFSAMGAQPMHRRAMAVYAGCVLFPIVPVLHLFFVAPNLEGSRYLYMSFFWWAAMMALAMSSARGRTTRTIAWLAGTVLLVISVAGVRLHLRAWTMAAHVRDKVEAEVVSVTKGGCESVHLSEAPDTVDGAYVFRNGLREAFRRDVALDVSAEKVPGCSFRWNGTRVERLSE